MWQSRSYPAFSTVASVLLVGAAVALRATVWTALACCLLAVVIWWRARFPLVVLTAAMVVLVVWLRIDMLPPVAAVVPLVVLLTAFDAGRCARSTGHVLWAFGIGLAGPLLALVLQFSPPVATVMAALTALMIALGAWTRTVRLGRTREREQEQHWIAERATLAERERIAHDLHDSLAHNLAIVTAQASGAQRIVLQDPQRAAEALGVIAETSRRAQREVRAVLGLIERETASESPEAQVAALLDGAAAGGLSVRSEGLDQLERLPANLRLVAYRVIQEALTNAIKHQGDGTQVRVTAHRSDRSLDLAIRSKSPDHPDPPPPAPAGGRGLAGMERRVRECGGSWSAEQVAPDTFEVRVQLPEEAT
ncbi:MAG: histidine kinase [Candidatus Nanopelagicales bacterium]